MEPSIKFLVYEYGSIFKAVSEVQGTIRGTL
jgi:hypothetical protein